MGSSALLHVVAAPLTYQLWRVYVEPGRIGRGEALPGWIWAFPLVYVVLPIVVGRLVGIGTRKRWRWVRPITGPTPAPTAWDHVFATGDLEAWVRLKLTDGTWLGGAYAKGSSLTSYAASYPDHRDLYLASTAVVDPATGEFVLDADGQVQLEAAGVLVRWEQVAYAVVEEATPR